MKLSLATMVRPMCFNIAVVCIVILVCVVVTRHWQCMEIYQRKALFDCHAYGNTCV